MATPIGHRADISARALAVLADADRVLCEDTRHTGRLLAHHGVAATLRPYHEHNAARARPGILRALDTGETIALVSDAGTPLISDPGYKLVQAAVARGHRVTGCPGPSAPLLALIVSGLPTDRFYFGGFLPQKTAARLKALTAVAGLDATLIFLESPRRLATSLASMNEVLGARPCAIARELTKRFEEVTRGDLATLVAQLENGPMPKGEIVVVIGGASEPIGALSDAALDARIDAMLTRMSVRDTADALAAETGLSRRMLYQRSLARAQETKD